FMFWVVWSLLTASSNPWYAGFFVAVVLALPTMLAYHVGMYIYECLIVLRDHPRADEMTLADVSWFFYWRTWVGVKACLAECWAPLRVFGSWKLVGIVLMAGATIVIITLVIRFLAYLADSTGSACAASFILLFLAALLCGIAQPFYHLGRAYWEHIVTQ